MVCDEWHIVDGERLLGDVAGRFWTEHSEMCCMASAAAAFGRDRATIDRLGQWSTSMSEAYDAEDRGGEAAV